jgi:predicted transposase/invertase (TIGR01784 family)
MDTERLNPLNDFLFLKYMGEKGDEVQLLAFLNAVLQRTGKDNLTSVEIIENKDLPAEIVGGKFSKLDVRAKLANGTKINIEVQLENQYNMKERSLYYWGLQYTKGIVQGDNYNTLPPVICINILDFSYIPVDDFHTSFHLYEDQHKDTMLSDALEIHCLDMVRFRKLKAKDILNNPLHRWLVYFDKYSPLSLVEEVIKMDAGIQRAQEKMDMIRRDPALLHAYEMYELTLFDEASRLYGARQEGKMEGKLEGEKNKALKIAGMMKEEGDSVEKIARMTGLSPAEIAGL